MDTKFPIIRSEHRKAPPFTSTDDLLDLLLAIEPEPDPILDNDEYHFKQGAEGQSPNHRNHQ